jgi:hypothetical protein
MTEEEWLARETLQNSNLSPPSWLREPHGYRKMFLFLAAYLRRLMFGRLCPACQAAFPLFEKQAEGQATVDDWKAAMRTKHTCLFGGSECATRRMFRATIQYLHDIFCPAVFWDALVQTHADVECQIQQQHRADTNTSWGDEHRAEIREIWRDGMSLLKEISGNPFHTVAVDPAWLTSDVLLLARGIYDERAFDRVPILADALQDAGCDSDDILTHLRGPGPHVRGCWALDLVLGKQ